MQMPPFSWPQVTRLPTRPIGGAWMAGVLLIALTWTGMAQAQAPGQAHSPARAALPHGLPDFSSLVERVGPSVVNIRTLEKSRKASDAEHGSEDEVQELLRRFFGIPFPKGPRAPRGPAGPADEPQPSGVGSGFVLTPDGYIMTNAHVIEGATQVIVTLTDKREFTAQVIGSDPRTDVAVVKIAATGLPAIQVGDVNRLKVGEWVIAIGSPFGLDHSVTAGIVSAKQRETGDYLPFIQTDVAINPGNSGGPLINMRGEVVGINSQIYSRSGGFMGISFAIPMNEAMRVSEQLTRQGRVTRGRIGVQIDAVSPELAQALGLGPARGALIRAVEADSPAEKAGLEAGDVVLAFDGQSVDKAADLPRLVGNTPPGKSVAMRVWRRGDVRPLQVTLAELQAAGTAAPQRPAAPARTPSGWGLTLGELSDAQKRSLRLRAGVQVEAATDAAAKAGLRPGDVILAVGNTEVSRATDFETAAARVPAKQPLVLLVRRAQAVQYILLKPLSSDNSE